MKGRVLANSAQPSTHDHPKQQQPTQQRVIVGLHLIALVLLALHIYARTLPPTAEAIPTPADAEAAWWGLWPMTYVPTLWFWLGIAAVLVTMSWSWRNKPASLTFDLPLRWLYALSALLLIAF